MSRRILLLTFCMLLAAAGFVVAQRSRSRYGGSRGQYTEGGVFVDESARTAREIASHSSGTPNWTNAAGFANDTFTFTRIRYSDNPQGWSGGT